MTRALNGSELLHELNPHLFHAYEEVLKKNHLPLPDRLFQKECLVDLKKFYLNYDENIFSKDEYGHYHLSCSDPHQNISLEFEM